MKTNLVAELEQAILEGDCAGIHEICLREPRLVHETGPSGLPAGLLAARKASLDVVRHLVEYSFISLTLRDGQGRTMLHHAAAGGRADVCRYLTERGGLRPDEGDYAGITPFEISVRSGHHEAAAYFEGVFGAPLSGMYRNPVRRGMFPDPSICAGDDGYYMVNSTFIYFPCIPVSYSRDLVSWEIVGYAVIRPDWAGLEGLEGGRGYWAPDISFDGKRWYITATLRLNDSGSVCRRQMVVSAGRPEGPYGEPAWIEEDGIDPSLFHEQGKHYMLLNRGARLLELNEDCTAAVSEPVLLYYGSMKQAPEGPHLLHRNGWYYLFQAEGGTGMGHRVTVARSRTLKGIYEPCPYNPILRQTDEKALLQRCGHGKPVCTPAGDWYLPYLCGRLLEGYTVLGRETALDPFEWTEDGWPVVNHGRGPSVLQKKPVTLPGTGSFAGRRRTAEGYPSPEWMSPRPMEPGAVRTEGGKVFLSSDSFPLSDVRATHLLLRRQTAFTFTASVWAETPSELKSGQEYGLICYYDENSWVREGIWRGNDGRLYAGVQEHIGTEFISHTPLCLPEAKLCRFTVRAEGMRRWFFLETVGTGPAGAEEAKDGVRGDVPEHAGLPYGQGVQEDAKQKKAAPSVSEPPPGKCTAQIDDTSYLSDEGVKLGKRFTGAMAGIYAVSSGEKFVACFTRFLYINEGEQPQEGWPGKG